MITGKKHGPWINVHADPTEQLLIITRSYYSNNLDTCDTGGCSELAAWEETYYDFNDPARTLAIDRICNVHRRK